MHAACEAISASHAKAYPRSPLREAADAQRMNILAGIDRARARAAAREYLARYPRGFARADAEAIAPDLP